MPTIGSVYEQAEKVVCYLSGLGRLLSSKADDFESDQCWFKRAWTLQEISEHPVIGGDTGDEEIRAKLEEKPSSLQKIHSGGHVYGVLSQMQEAGCRQILQIKLLGWHTFCFQTPYRRTTESSPRRMHG